MASDAIDETRLGDADPDRTTAASNRPVSRDRYRLGVLLGRGGMATVVESEDTWLHRSVAVKRLHPEFAGKADALNRFFDEAELMAALDHPGTVAVHDAGLLESGEPFYAMAKVRGRTLATLLTEHRAAGGGFDITLVDVFQRAAETVAYAHAQGIIHRDLKPENVMVDKFGAVYVMDWGLAKRAGPGADRLARTVSGVVMGTPAYMPPEAMSEGAHAVDARSDVFALGAILYQILTGDRPFHGRTLAEMVERVRHHDPPSPRRLNRDVPRELSAICMKALAKDPGERYSTAGELAEDVRRARAYLPVAAAPPGPIDRARHWMQRHPRQAGALGALVLVTLVIAVTAGFALMQQRAMRQEIWAAYERTAAIQRSIEADLARLRAERRTPVDGPQSLTAVYREAELERRLELSRNDAGTTLGALLGFSRFDPDSSAVAAMTARFRATLRDAEARGDWVFIRAFAASRLALIEQLGDRNPVPAEETGYLRATLERADGEIAERIRSGLPPDANPRRQVDGVGHR